MIRSGLFAALLVVSALAPAGLTAQQDAVVEGDDLTVADAEWNAWSPNLWCRLLEEGEPAVRVLVADVVSALRDGPSPITCGDPPTAPEPRAIRQAALEADGNDPAGVARVYLAECAGKLPAPFCEERDLRAELVALDPDNAFPHLLYLRAPAELGRPAQTFDGEELEHLLAAASADTVDGYWGHDTADVLDAVQRVLPGLPPLEFSDAARAELEETGLPPDRLGEFALFEVFSVEAARAVPGWLRLQRGCAAARRAGDEIAVDGCRALGRLLTEQGRNDLQEGLGRALLTGRGSEAPTGWRDELRGLIRYCGQPRGRYGDWRLPGPLPEDDTPRYLRDLERLGEREASARKAAREYAAYPEAFPLAPERCEAIATLADADQRRLAERWSEARTRGADAQDRVLSRAADLLNDRADSR